MSDTNILDILDELNDEMGKNPLFEFITVIMIVKNKIDKERENIKKLNTPSIEHLKKLLSLHDQIKKYMTSNDKLIKSVLKGKCDIEKFEKMEMQLDEIDLKIDKISIRELDNVYLCIYENLNALQQTILETIKAGKNSITSIINNSDEILTTESKGIAKLEDETSKTEEDIDILIDDLVSEIKNIYGNINSTKDELDDSLEKIETVKEKLVKITDFLKSKKSIIDNLTNVNESIYALTEYNTKIEKVDKIKLEINEIKEDMDKLMKSINKYLIDSDKIFVQSEKSTKQDKKITISDIFKKIKEVKTQIDINRSKIDTEILSVLETIKKIHHEQNKEIQIVSTNISSILDKIISSDETNYNECNAIYSLKQKTILYILNAFVSLLADKTPKELKKLINNLFVYLRVNKGFRYNGGMGMGSGRDIDFTLNELEEYKQGKSATIPTNPHYYEENKKIKTDSKLKLFQLFLIILVKIAINIYNVDTDNTGEQKDQKVLKTITINFDTKTKQIKSYKYSGLSYEDAIKKDNGQQLHIDKLPANTLPELVGGNSDFYYEKYKKYKYKYVLLKSKKYLVT